MRYSIIKIFLFLFSYSFFAANLSREAKNALANIQGAISENKVLYVENPNSMPDRDDVRNNDVISFKKESYDTISYTKYLNKYIHKDSDLLLYKNKVFKTNDKLEKLTKFLSRNKNGASNKQYGLKIWSCVDDTNMYYYFEKIHPNLDPIEQEPPKKKKKLLSGEEKRFLESSTTSTSTSTSSEIESLIEEICANPIATFMPSNIDINTKTTCFQPIIEHNILTPKQEIDEIIEKIACYFYKDLTYINFLNYEYNTIYLADKHSFCKIENSDIKMSFSLYNFEMFKFKFKKENSAWYIKMINTLTGKIEEFIYIHN
jgi:hypothetical protein